MMNEKRFKIDTTSEIGHIYINNQDGEHMSWIEVENTLNEQQATIRKLQDLCGESDGENAKLRIENEQLKHYKLYEDNKRLQTIIADLKEENEQLRKELNNFKPVMFQDVRKGTVILYSKGDSDE